MGALISYIYSLCFGRNVTTQYIPIPSVDIEANNKPSSNVHYQSNNATLEMANKGTDAVGSTSSSVVAPALPKVKPTPTATVQVYFD